MVITLHQTSKIKFVFCFFTHFWSFFGGFPNFWGISQKNDPKCLTWLESSGNKCSNNTFPKFLGGTSKCTEFCDGRGNLLCTIAQSVSYQAVLPGRGTETRVPVWRKKSARSGVSTGRGYIQDIFKC